MRVQTKILLVLVPLVVIPLLALGWAAYNQLRATAEQKTLDQIETLLDQVGRQVQDHLRTTRANLELFSESVLLQSYLLTEDEEERYTLMQPTLLRLFASYRKSYPDYYEIRILLPDGYEDSRIARDGLANVTDEEAASPYFRAATNSAQDLYSTYLRNPDNGELALVAMKRISLRDRAVATNSGAVGHHRGTHRAWVPGPDSGPAVHGAAGTRQPHRSRGPSVLHQRRRRGPADTAAS